ncbi:hypothetical protein B0T26DRAFT_724126 [Lasiosphaeria miniovina]|uniref:C2H2-type domain-containing protein n=1 Tax=Lasiosphaeria miniovina TaxID=1954250 RepID=A0AA40DNV0_9PEZI|nr:uncharacterized protein B0T26DRAFT_724126 [Lasiosphaeria miniovina]KAK0710120.1 hypothetical protein B0T26DRAFT_724126 [Lasiosphaeria miniovina]
MDANVDDEEIKTWFWECNDRFRACLSVAVFSDDDWMDDRAADFNVWGFSIKADATGRSSLDYRLRNWPEVRSIVVGLLKSLSHCLEAIEKAASSQNTNSNPISPAAETAGEPDVNAWSDFSDDSDGAEQETRFQPSGPFSEGKIQIAATIDQLVRITVAIKQSGNRRRLDKADESFDESKYPDLMEHFVSLIRIAHLDIREISGSLQAGLDSTLLLDTVQRRLVRLNLLRHHRIKHATRFRKKADHVIMGSAPNIPKISALVPTVITPSRKGKRQTQEPQLAQAQSVQASKSAQTTSTNPTTSQLTATELGSQFKLPSAPGRKYPSSMTNISRIGSKQDYPKFPGTKGLFHCPYCSQTLYAEDFVGNISRWKNHVAQDISPYACIFEHCDSPDELYVTSEEWNTHMRNNHSQVRWLCNICMNKATSFATKNDWESHVTTSHANSFPQDQVAVLGELSRRTVYLPPSCPLCPFLPDEGQQGTEDHIAGHLHQFALRCLPGNIDDGDASSSGSRGAQSHIFDFDDDDAGEEFEDETSDPDDRLARARKRFLEAGRMAYQALNSHFSGSDESSRLDVRAGLDLFSDSSQGLLHPRIYEKLIQEHLEFCTRSFVRIRQCVEQVEVGSGASQAEETLLSELGTTVQDECDMLDSFLEYNRQGWDFDIASPFKHAPRIRYELSRPAIEFEVVNPELFVSPAQASPAEFLSTRSSFIPKFTAGSCRYYSKITRQLIGLKIADRELIFNDNGKHVAREREQILRDALPLLSGIFQIFSGLEKEKEEHDLWGEDLEQVQHIIETVKGELQHVDYLMRRQRGFFKRERGYSDSPVLAEG